MEIEKPEVTADEADRFLVYEKCVRCHHLNPQDILGLKNVDWTERLQTEKARPEVELTDEEAGRILRYLQEKTR